MRYTLAFFLLLFLSAYAFGDNYFNKPLHTDINLSPIVIPAEKEITDLLKDRSEIKDTVLNYLKAAEFNTGRISKAQSGQYETALSALDELKRKKIKKIAEDFFSSKSYKISVIDITGSEYYLPIKVIDSGK